MIESRFSLCLVSDMFSMKAVLIELFILNLLELQTLADLLLKMHDFIEQVL